MSDNQNQVKIVPLMISLLMCGFMGMFSETALNIALHHLMIEFDVSAATVQWLTTSYLLVLGILIPISGLLIRRFKTKKIFITAILFSITGLVLAANSPNFFILLLGRIIQACGTGLVTPLLFNTILVVFPPNRRGVAMGIVGLVMMFAPAIGPAVSGFIIEHLSWHWVFWIPIPFLIISLYLGLIYLIDLSITDKPAIDYVSIVLSTLGFSGLVMGVSLAGEEHVGWTSVSVLVSLSTGLISLILFGWRQLILEEPILNIRVFKHPMFVMGIGLTVLSNMIIFSSNLLLPMYIQGGLGLSSAAAGLLLLPGGVINGIMSLVNGHLFDKYGPRWLVIPGFILGFTSVLVFSQISTTTHGLTIIVFYTLLMVGMSMITTPSQTNGLNQLERSNYPDGTAIVNTTIQTSGAIGTAIAVSILNRSQNAFLAQVNNPQNGTAQIGALVQGIQHAYNFAVIVAIIGLICSLFIKRVLVTQLSLKKFPK
ncbi:DHA2 family efflux MFS transporter permease subunit [Bacillus sp. SD088]|uniref:DHA2 family efflux MFS transporter permease subunit n=1 Tax=Bacillus sp. SD088 TaxID=2782012 RepID=UPI001A979735|nr:DHA2 family efflux MFS transporter permease subunit [Bacillus sp. SD088]MBO0993140.1 multidrug efflux MFS transporter [Bacillus sp. SD088]